MTFRAGLALFLLAACVFLATFHSAYSGFFRDDDYDNAIWTTVTPFGDYLKGIATPLYLKDNFRPAGHLYFRWMSFTFGLDYPKYVAVLHAVHLLNVVLVWQIARSIGAGPVAASLGTVWFLLPMGAIETVWQPMYVFDVLCAFFSLAAVLLYIKGRPGFAFVLFWLGVKAKEPAVLTPVVLAAWEWWIGPRRFWRLAPFLLVAGLAGWGGLSANHGVHGTYGLDFSVKTLAKTVSFYSSRILVVPFGGLALLAMLMVWRKGVWLGLLMALVFLAPVLVLPSHLFAAYTYLPLAGVALAVSSIAAADRLAPVMLLTTLWLVWAFSRLPATVSGLLDIANENRQYVESISRGALLWPQDATFVFDRTPAKFQKWGINSVLRRTLSRSEVALYPIESEEGFAALTRDPVVRLFWDPKKHSLTFLTRPAGREDAAYITTGDDANIWQLGEGWYGVEPDGRWMRLYANVRLMRTSQARELEIQLIVRPELVAAIGKTIIAARIGEKFLGHQPISTPGPHTIRWALPEPGIGPTTVLLFAEPEFRLPGDPRLLGVVISAIGFRP